MTDHDFDASIVRKTDHRPWPMPQAPWVMTQTWHDLLFAHWRVDAARLRARIPKEFELDLFDDSAWLGVVPFHMTNVAPRGSGNSEIQGSDGTPYRLEIHHPPWSLQPARATFERNTMAAALGLSLGPPATVHFARRQDAIAWAPSRLDI